MNAKQAIDRSASHSAIVHLAFDAEVISTLTIECEDSVESDSSHEFWGTTGSGSEWRVHVSLPGEPEFILLRSEAAEAGDADMIDICDRALRGSQSDIEKCRRTLAAAAAAQ